MKVEIYKGIKIELYDSIMELPEERFALFNRNILVDSGIGSDLEAFDAKLSKLVKFIEKDDKEKCKIEIDNLRHCYYLMMNDINPEMNAFACFVKSINGKEMSGSSDSDIKKIRKLIRKEKLPIGMIKVILNGLKKKLKLN